MEPEVTILSPWLAVIFAALVVIFWVVVIWVGVRMWRTWRASNSPIEILKQRFARGEIDAREFDERRRKLEG